MSYIPFLNYLLTIMIKNLNLDQKTVCKGGYTHKLLDLNPIQPRIHSTMIKHMHIFKYCSGALYST